MNNRLPPLEIIREPDEFSYFRFLDCSWNLNFRAVMLGFEQKLVDSKIPIAPPSKLLIVHRVHYYH